MHKQPRDNKCFVRQSYLWDTTSNVTPCMTLDGSGRRAQVEGPSLLPRVLLSIFRRGSIRRVLLPSAVLLLTAGCDLGMTPNGPSGATPFDPPDIYQVWAAEVGQAANRDGSIGRVRWYIVPGDYWQRDGSRKKTIGQWFSDGRIFIATPWTKDEGLIKHEILHELLGGDTDHRHPLFSIYQEGMF